MHITTITAEEAARRRVLAAIASARASVAEGGAILDAVSADAQWGSRGLRALQEALAATRYAVLLCAGDLDDLPRGPHGG